MLRKILLASTALVAFAGLASAADMPARMPVKAPVPYVALYNWTGFYAGVNLGYGWGHASDDLGLSTSLNSIIGGAQIGYNWQTNNVVFGLETDFQWSGQKQTGSAGPFTLTERIKYFGTVRGRVGYAWDRTLLYLTGGYAYTNVSADLSGPGGTASANSTKGGGTVGAGLEYAFAGPWTAKLEYLYVDTGSQSITLLGVTENVRVRNHVARVGVNYRF